MKALYSSPMLMGGSGPNLRPYWDFIDFQASASCLLQVAISIRPRDLNLRTNLNFQDGYLPSLGLNSFTTFFSRSDSIQSSALLVQKGYDKSSLPLSVLSEPKNYTTGLSHLIFICFKCSPPRAHWPSFVLFARWHSSMWSIRMSGFYSSSRCVANEF